MELMRGDDVVKLQNGETLAWLANHNEPVKTIKTVEDLQMYWWLMSVKICPKGCVQVRNNSWKNMDHVFFFNG